MDSFDEWKFKQNIMVNGLNAKTIADMDTIPWNNSQIHIPEYYISQTEAARKRYMGMIGKKYGKLTVLDVKYGTFREDTRQDPLTYVATCICDCGNIVTRDAHDIYYKGCLSCGCSTRKLNQYEIHGDYTIVYYKGMKFILDTIVFNHLRHFRIGYNYSHKSLKNIKVIMYPVIRVVLNYKKITVPLHKLLLPAPYGYVVDHINRDTFDARYNNLRVIPKEENAMNCSTRTTKSNDLPLGVYYNNCGNYVAFLRNKGKFYSKTFKTLEEAIKYREELERKYHVYHPIEVEKLVLPNGELNPKYPYEKYPIGFWHALRINPFVAYRI